MNNKNSFIISDPGATVGFGNAAGEEEILNEHQQ